MENIYFLTINKTNENLSITEFQSSEHGLSKDYQFKLILNKKISNYFKKNEKLATLKINTDVLIHGYIQQKNKNTLILNAPLHLLSSQNKSYIYQNINIIDLIESILKKYRYKNVEYTIKIENTNKFPKKTWTQYNETDSNFLKRHLAFWGITYFYIQSEKNAKIIFTDYLQNNSIIKTISYIENCGFNTSIEHAFDFQIEWLLTTQKTTCNGYNYNKPFDTDTHEEKNNTLINAHGEWHYFGLEYANEQSGKYLSEIRQKVFDVEKNKILLKTNYTNLTPGEIVSISGLKILSNHYKIINIEHFAKLEKSFTKKTDKSGYFNIITLIPSHIPFIPKYTKSLATACLYQTATIKGDNYTVPNIDKDGRYYFLYNFDKKNNYSLKTRLLQPYNTYNGGHHFPLYNDTKVIIGYFDNNLDDPIILGSIENQNTPLSSAQHVIQSNTKTQLKFNEDKNTRKIKISTPDQNIEMSSHELNNIKINSKKGDIHITAKSNIEQSTTGTHCINSNHDYVTSSNEKIEIKTVHNDISIISEKNITQFHKKACNIIANNVIISSIADLKIKCSNAFVTSKNKGLKIYNEAERVVINSASVLLKSTTKIIVSQKNARIVIDKNGKVYIQAPKIIFKNKKINSKSNDIKLGGQAKLKTPIPLLTEKENYLIKLFYRVGEKNSPIRKTFVTLIDKKTLKSDEISDNKGFIALNELQHRTLSNIFIKNQAVIKLNEQYINQPLDTISINEYDFKNIDKKSYSKSAIIECLFPPIIVNIREDVQNQYARSILSTEEIEYFKQNGQNATIFIHGYNVPYGGFSNQVTNVQPTLMEPFKQHVVHKFNTVLNHSEQTIYTDIGPYVNTPEKLTNFSETLGNLHHINGTGAHNWLIHMEDNMNRATQQFDRTNYKLFTRLISIAWSGDLGALHFIEAEPRADKASEKMIDLILQLAN
ncbi:MAG: type VI secretion system tip protein VgrG, partial [Gammaproteobacteria bacterium]